MDSVIKCGYENICLKSFVFQIIWKKGEVISVLFSNFALECVMRDIKANPQGLKLHGPHYLWSGKGEESYLLRRRVVDVAQRRPRFDPRSVHVWLVVNIGILGQFCFQYFGIIQLSLHTYISIYVQSTLKIAGINSFIKIATLLSPDQNLICPV